MNLSPLTNDVREALRLQRRSIDLIEQNLDEEFARAVDSILAASSIVTSGIGKSGFVARKFAASLTSLGVPATFIHAVDAMHGDLGAVANGAVLVVFSKSGDTRELINLIEVLPEDNGAVICVTARRGSTISKRSNITLLAPIDQEYDRMNILPTASTTAAMIVADLLVMAVAHAKPDTLEVLSKTHPNGSIGSLLRFCVDDHMHSGGQLPVVSKGATLEAAVHMLDKHALGIVCVVGDENRLCGILTDGDVRRLVERGAVLSSMSVDQVMTMTPTTIECNASLYEALQKMETQERAISVLPVVDVGANTLQGVIRLHDVVRAQMAG
jgi:arabinose-5-phosphate isomerase